MSQILDAALAWHDAGYTILRASTDGSKKPAGTWKQYQTSRPTRDQITGWFRNNYPGMGMICGATSGGAEMLELEGRAIEEGAHQHLLTLIDAAGLRPIWDRITAGYTENTPAGGIHWIYRIADAPVPSNTKLASRPATLDELAERPEDRIKVLAETRGEGGWVVIAPSNGATHPTGRAWTTAAGGPEHVATITMAEREQIHRAVRCLDQMPTLTPSLLPAPPKLGVTTDGGLSPGDDYEARTDWADLLGPHGWTLVSQHGRTRYWRRPGKDRGLSASTGHADDRDRLYVFTSSTVFEMERPYNLFGAYALLEHGGDHSAAARALRADGYGSPPPPAPPTVATTPTDDLWAGTDATPTGSGRPAPDRDTNPEEHTAWAAEERATHDRQRLAAETDLQLLRLRAQQAAREQLDAELAEKAKAAAKDSTRIIAGGAFLLDVPDLPPAVWGKGEDILWARGEALLIAGPQGTGKTTIAGQLVRAAVGLGARELLGLPVATSTNRVLYLAMDRPKQTQRALGRMFYPEERDYLDEVLRFWIGPPPADIAAIPETLLRLAQEHDADTIFVDSLKDAAVGLSKDEVGAGYNRARQLALAEGIEIVELHHMVKNSPDGKAPRHLKDIFGSTWITAGVGSVMLLWGEAGDPVVEMHHLKQPINEVGPFHVVHDRASGGVNVWHDPDADVIALARSKGRAGIDAQMAAQAIYGTDKPTRAQKEKARRRLGEYVALGLLVQLGSSGHGGRGVANRWVAAASGQWPQDDEEQRERYP